MHDNRHIQTVVKGFSRSREQERRQAFIVIIIVVSVKFEQWHISNANNEESLIKTRTHICFYFGLQLSNSYILKGKNVAILINLI